MLAPVRGHDSSSENTFDRLLSTLLTEIEGIATDSDSFKSDDSSSSGSGSSSSSGSSSCAKSMKHVVVLAATNNIRWLDPSILRSGVLCSARCDDD